MKDTPDDVAALYRRMLMARSGGERMMMASRSFDAARTMFLASLPPGLSESDRRCALLRRLYGRDLDSSKLVAVEQRIRNDCRE